MSASKTLGDYDRFERLQCDLAAPGVLRIRITSPHKLNVMDALLHRELSEIWDVVDKDAAMACVLLTASGDHFSAGGYLPYEQQVQQSYARRVQVMDETRSIVLGMVRCSKPIVSTVRGWAVGAGLACALLADICIVDKAAKLCDGHTKIGLVTGDHAALVWPLLCGMAKAKLYLLTSRSLNGEEAERIGLVAMSVDERDLDRTGLELCAGLAGGAAHAIRWTKRTLNLWLRQFEPVFEASLAYEFFSFPGPEALEGMQAVMEKRVPVFPPPELPPIP